jgi:hypothetical protein
LWYPQSYDGWRIVYQQRKRTIGNPIGGGVRIPFHKYGFG